MLINLSKRFESSIAERGFKRVQKIGRNLGKVLWFILRKRRNLAVRAIQKHLDYSETEAKKIAYSNFLHTGIAFLESVLTHKINEAFFINNIVFDSESKSHWEAMLAYQKPIIATTAHFGAWELLSGILGYMTIKRPTVKHAVVVRTQNNKFLENRITAMRSATGAEVIGHRNASLKILKVLKNNGLVAFLVDHNCKRREAIFLPFLNDLAAVNIGPATLAVRSNAAVWPIFLLRLEQDKYQYIVKKPLVIENLLGSTEDKIKQVAEFYTKNVEKIIQKYPEQWFWMHKRWKTRPLEDIKF